MFQQRCEVDRQSQAARGRVIGDVHSGRQDSRFGKLLDEILNRIDLVEVDLADDAVAEGRGEIEQFANLLVDDRDLVRHEIGIGQVAQPVECALDHADKRPDVEVAEVEQLVHIFVRERQLRPARFFEDAAFERQLRADWHIRRT